MFSALKLLVSADRCIPPMFLCASDERNMCLRAEDVCDGVADCPMGDDEGFFCDDKYVLETVCSNSRPLTKDLLNVIELRHYLPNIWIFVIGSD